MRIYRNNKQVYNDQTSINRMKRSLTELAQYLFRECDFKYGCFLMTGTCLVPPNDFTLQKGDMVSISISGIGELINTVNYKP
jgi:2-dehydro-3-deoxy-D-arabinonate dehydratase